MDLSLACKHSHNELERFYGIETLYFFLEKAPLNEITIQYVTYEANQHVYLCNHGQQQTPLAFFED